MKDNFKGEQFKSVYKEKWNKIRDYITMYVCCEATTDILYKMDAIEKE